MSLNDILDIDKNILMLMLGPQLHSNKRIWVKPEVNRGYTLELVSHHQPQQSIDCVKNTAGPPIGHIQMGSPILRISTLCSTVLVQPDNEEIMKAPHCWPFVMGIHRWRVDFPHKDLINNWLMCKAFPCHCAISEYGVAAMFAVVRMTKQVIRMRWHQYHCAIRMS